MEKTNELNKFLSYIHMGNSIFRIYDKQAEKFHDEKLKNLFSEIMETFKTHEESITKLIKDEGEIPTKSVTFAGKFGIYSEKLKVYKNPLAICKSAIKATYKGMLSSLKFLDENKALPEEVETKIINVIDDYGLIANKLKEYTLTQYR